MPDNKKEEHQSKSKEKNEKSREKEEKKPDSREQSEEELKLSKEKDEKKEASASTSAKQPDVMLSVDPDTAYFNAGGGTSTHMLVNTSDERLCVKVRSSNNQLYRVSPVAMFIEPGQCQHLSVSRLAGPARPDKLVIQFLPCDSNDKDAKEFYTTIVKKDITPKTLRINLKMADQKPKTYTSLEVCE